MEIVIERRIKTGIEIVMYGLIQEGIRRDRNMGYQEALELAGAPRSLEKGVGV